ncbi:1-phosphofructokinase family hexose kinase [Fodinibius halophilus]|uniref:1-phosphofructokinase family hexose kinase n=1 Tax=Fodinibius halophilus TaxID=1736908 RepID=A0A6M1TGE3_9BACT|nr:1-phosphofructokinase family hexose kinase [Fodinibius halophilus]NGP89172.1 1-phosphofructokinase family hexose kinase [Fodinibius halophilus]
MILAVCANPSVDAFWDIDEINKGTTNRSANEQYFPGGKGIHVAFALQELNEQVTALGVWGGVTGRWIQEECHKKDIATIGPEVEEWTRTCITNRCDTDWADTELLGAGPSLTPGQSNDFLSIYRRALTESTVKAVVLSGSVPKGMSQDIYKQMITEARTHDIPAYVDASNDLLEHALEANPFAVHINQKEGKALTGHNNPVKIAKSLRKQCHIAAVTAGKDGLYLAANNHIYHGRYSINKQDIISTIGSGDCLLAGLCKAILTRDDIEEWTKLATACGSANCIHPKLGMFKAQDVNRIFNQVRLEIL